MAGRLRLQDESADRRRYSQQGEEMTTMTPYLLFAGNCRQAMEFYKSCLGGELILTAVKDTPAKEKIPASQHDKVLNARLRGSNVDISASDWLRPDRIRVQGNAICLFLSGGTFQELKSLFDKLSVGGEVTDPLSQQFFGTYGALNDQFGFRWMFHTHIK
jgi:PhnB protein